MVSQDGGKGPNSWSDSCSQLNAMYYRVPVEAVGMILHHEVCIP